MNRKGQNNILYHMGLITQEQFIYLNKKEDEKTDFERWGEKFMIIDLEEE